MPKHGHFHGYIGLCLSGQTVFAICYYNVLHILGKLMHCDNFEKGCTNAEISEELYIQNLTNEEIEI